jgi:acetyltransferase-like isoleucine patch superfamily enzyme
MVGDFLRSLKSECLEWHRSFLAAIPGEIGCKVRNCLYGYQAERGCRVLRGVTIYFPERLKLGRNVGISPHSQFNAAGGIEIGDDTLVGPGCTFWSVNHRFDDTRVPIRLQGYDAQEIVVGRDCWIAARAIVLPGVHIGDGSVVAAGAVVNRTCAPRSILAGVPAKVIGTRESVGNLNRERAERQR